MAAVPVDLQLLEAAVLVALADLAAVVMLVVVAAASTAEAAVASTAAAAVAMAVADTGKSL
jgi:hypothetical protein